MKHEDMIFFQTEDNKEYVQERAQIHMGQFQISEEELEEAEKIVKKEWGNDNLAQAKLETYYCKSAQKAPDYLYKEAMIKALETLRNHKRGEKA